MSLLQRAARQLGQRAAAAQHQQQRLVGNMPVKPNKYVEDWGTRREHIEKEFRWDTKSLTTLAIWCGLVPYAIYRVTVAEFNKVDDAAGRPQRAMWGNDR